MKAWMIARRIAAGAAVAVSPLHARANVTQSLSTTFVEVLVEGVPLATRYVVGQRTIDISNKGEVPMSIRCDAMVPRPYELRSGYDPVPDEAWVGFEPRSVEIGPGQTASVKVALYTPDDPAQAGRRYQAMLWLHADATKGSMLAVGLKPRLLFSLASKDAKAGSVRVENAPQFLAKTLPYLVVAEPGAMVFPCGTITAGNPWDEEMTYEVVRDPGAIRKIDVDPGETPVPDPAWVEVLPQAVVLPGRSKAELAVTARIPIAAEHFGRVYVAALRTVARRKGQKDVDVFNKIRIEVPKMALTATATGGMSKN